MIGLMTFYLEYLFSMMFWRGKNSKNM